MICDTMTDNTNFILRVSQRRPRSSTRVTRRSPIQSPIGSARTSPRVSPSRPHATISKPVNKKKHTTHICMGFSNNDMFSEECENYITVSFIGHEPPEINIQYKQNIQTKSFANSLKLEKETNKRPKFFNRFFKSKIHPNGV